MGQGIGMRTLYMDYKSLGEVLDHLDQDRATGADTDSEGNTPSERWDLNLGYQGALDAYTGGWSEGALKAYELAERIIPRPLATRTHLVRSVAGGMPNVGAYLAGAPDAMYQVSRKQATGRPYVHLYMPIGYLGGIYAETAFNRGCALVAIADALETVGCRVKITLTRNSEMAATPDTRLTMRFMVKDYGDRLDVDQLIFTAAHPAMFRRICFALQERSEHKAVVRQTRNGYGRSCNLEMEDTEPDGKAILVMFPRLIRNGGTPESFLEQMVRSLPDDLQTEIKPINPNERG